MNSTAVSTEYGQPLQYEERGDPQLRVKPSHETTVEDWILPDLRLYRPGRKSGINWHQALQILDFALQPIVNIHTGMCDGCEALLRRYQDAGFPSIQAVFNTAHDDLLLPEVEMLLRAKAIHKFMEIPIHHRMKLFYNIDNRLLTTENGASTNINLADFIRHFGLYPGSFVYEISERHEDNMNILNDLRGLEMIKGMLRTFRQEMFKFAIDDFGTGLSGLQLLYHSEPDYMKIDRFFIDGLSGNRRKKLFVASTVNMARTLGNSVIAEGVETAKDFYACAQVGCDYVQGYLIQQPTLDPKEICETYEIVADLRRRDRRNSGHDKHLISNQLENIRPIPLYTRGEMTSMDHVFETFRQDKTTSLFPVIDPNHAPLGVLREKDLKEYVYSPFGKDILRNRATSTCHLNQFITRIPTIEIRSRVESILELFSLNPDCEGVLVTDNGRYQGFLNANALLKLLSDKNLEEARDQNPLTRLPGNFLINRYISDGLGDKENGYAYVYFDFDNFKPFNDKYGLRHGDRAIMMFADILKEAANTQGCFVGHVGGDDFFAGIKVGGEDGEVSRVEKLVREICSRFSTNAASIYNEADRKNGFIIAKDREEHTRRFPLLTVSAALLHLPVVSERSHSQEEIYTLLAELKKQAKMATDKLAILSLTSDRKSKREPEPTAMLA